MMNSRSLQTTLTGVSYLDSVLASFSVIRGLTLSIVLFLLTFIPAPVLGEHENTTSSAFLPTWRLLANEQKQQFIAGYLQGFSDAAKLTNIAIGFIDENPGKARETLEQLQRIYDSSGLTPSEIVEYVDKFYSDPDNKAAGLSVAVSAARATARSKS